MDWTTVLGFFMFGLPVDNENRKFQPTFRSLISYFIRRGRDAFSTPFEYYRKQMEWGKQVNNALLLGLAWEDARDLQLLKDKQKLLANLKQLKKDTESGVVTGIFGSLGELETMKVQLESQSHQRKEALGNFRVYPQYHELEQNANRLTAELHEITNENLIDKRLLDFYQSSLDETSEPLQNDVAQIYADAHIELPNLVIRRLEEVENFHRQLIENRREFLSTEINRLKRTISSPNILIHDSTIFDGVDERQVARAIELAARESQERGFQYICTLNSDMIPRSEFSSDFDFDSFVRLTLTDDTDQGRLLGIRY